MYTSLPQKALEVNCDAESQEMVFVKLSFSFYLQDLLFILVFVHCAVSLKCKKFLSVVSLLELLQQIILREALHWALTVQAMLCVSQILAVSVVFLLCRFFISPQCCAMQNVLWTKMSKSKWKYRTILLPSAMGALLVTTSKLKSQFLYSVAAHKQVLNHPISQQKV